VEAGGLSKCHARGQADGEPAAVGKAEHGEH